MHNIQWTPCLSVHRVQFGNVGASGTHPLFRALEQSQKLVVGGIRTCTKYEASWLAHVRSELVK